MGKPFDCSQARAHHAAIKLPAGNVGLAIGVEGRREAHPMSAIPELCWGLALKCVPPGQMRAPGQGPGYPK